MKPLLPSLDVGVFANPTAGSMCHAGLHQNLGRNESKSRWLAK